MALEFMGSETDGGRGLVKFPSRVVGDSTGDVTSEPEFSCSSKEAPSLASK